MRCMWQKVMMVNVITTENENEGDKNDNKGDKNGNKGDKNAPLTRLVAFTGLHGDQGEEQAGQVFPGVGEAGAGGRARAGRRVGAGRD